MESPRALNLDGNPEETIELASSSAAPAWIDPFEAAAEPDPFFERLDALQPPPAPTPASESLQRGRPPAARRLSRRLEKISGEPPARRWTTTPALSEIELPESTSWLDRLLNGDERRRLAALAHLVEGEAPYDRFGFSPSAVRAAFPVMHALYRYYFRVTSSGHEHVPSAGPAILAGNHGGLLPFDGAMTVVDLFLHTDPPRLTRAIVERWAGTLPWVNIFYARVGQVIGTRENFANLLADGQSVLVFPEGVDGIRKPITQRYRLRRFHVGFVEQALLARAPIVPVAVIGADDQTPILYDIKPLARRLGLPVAPITPTFPWLGPLGLLPYPVRYRIVYGEPLNFHERFGPEGASDTRLVRYLANQVRRTVQMLVDRSRA